MKIRIMITVAFQTLSFKEKTRLLLAFLAQALLSLMELSAVLFFSILANLIVTQNLYIQNELVNKFFLETLNFGSYGVASQITMLSIIIIVIFSCRGIVTAIYLQRLTYFFVRKSVEMQCKILTSLLKEGRSKIEEMNKQELQSTLIRGISALYSRTLGGLITIGSDSILVLAVVAGLFVFDYIMMLLVIALFCVVILVVGRRTKIYIAKNSKQELRQEVMAKVRIYEILDGYKEFVFNSDIDRTINGIRKPLLSQSLSAAKLSFIPIFNRYLYEVLLLLMIFLMSAFAFYRYETRVALSVLATLVLGLSRLIPAILRIQQQVNGMRISLPYAQGAIDMLEKFTVKSHRTSPVNQLVSANVSEERSLTLKDVSFFYADQQTIIDDITIDFVAGKSSVIVGASGAGKTTLVDVISGIRKASKGSIRWQHVELDLALQRGYLRIGYVPQEVKLISGTIRENILLNRVDVPEEHFQRVKTICGLDNLINGLELGEETQVGDGSRSLSGGETQKIGLARAILHRPHILILDEFTSGLDVDTESAILDLVLTKLKDTIIISIAHRISAIDKFDRVIELASGKVAFVGSSDEWKRERLISRRV